MARKIRNAAGWVILALVLQGVLISQARQVPVADYEMEYFRVDEPAYHMTLTKRVLGNIRERVDGGAAIQDFRQVVSILRLAGLMAAIGIAGLCLNMPHAGWAIGIFLFLPPTLPYLVRLDSWMDSVSFSLITFCLFAIGWRRTPRIFVLCCFLAGIFSGFAIDAKITSLLTLAPAAGMFLWKHPRAALFGFSAGLLCASAIQWDWMVHPSKMMEHVDHWRTVNAAIPPVPVSFVFTALFSSIPACILCLAAAGIAAVRREKSLRASVVLFASSLVFFMFYRTFEPDGIRHLYLALPFLAALAAWKFSELKIGWKIGVLIVWAAEMALREFSKY